jgi:ssDNA-binding Zn-finger/Zn-ribbon topoisomerase 1
LFKGWIDEKLLAFSVKDINYKHITTIKPTLGLVERIVKKSEGKGQSFLGCSSFPKCRYIKD